MPSPKWALRWLAFSPVASHTTLEFFGSTATQPMDDVPWLELEMKLQRKERPRSPLPISFNATAPVLPGFATVAEFVL